MTYYRNHAGKVAVSLDGGTTIRLPTGRLVPLDEAWSEVDDDLFDELTPEQRVHAVPAIARAEARAEAEQARREAGRALGTLADSFNQSRKKP